MPLYANKTRYNCKRQGKKIGSHYLPKMLLIVKPWAMIFRQVPSVPLYVYSNWGSVQIPSLPYTNCYIYAASIYHPPCIYTSSKDQLKLANV